jgi:hypothetical protein
MLSFNSVCAKSRFPDLLEALAFRGKWCCWNRISWRTLHVIRIDGDLQDITTKIPDARLNGQAAGLALLGSMLTPAARRMGFCGARTSWKNTREETTSSLKGTDPGHCLSHSSRRQTPEVSGLGPRCALARFRAASAGRYFYHAYSAASAIVIAESRCPRNGRPMTLGTVRGTPFRFAPCESRHS